MLELGPTLGRGQSESKRELTDDENRKSGRSRVKILRSVRMRKRERLE